MKRYMALVITTVLVSLCFAGYGHVVLSEYGHGLLKGYGQFLSCTERDEFVFQSWQTPLNTLNFVLYGTTGSVLLFDYGNGYSETKVLSSGSNSFTYNYSSTGVYTVRITGDVWRIREYSASDASLVLTLEQMSSLYNLVGFSSSTARSITGDISHIPRKVTDFNCWGAISGDLADLPPTMTAFLAKGSCQISDYTFGHTWASGMRSFMLDVRSPYGLSTAEVDDLLIDMSNTTWINEKEIEILGNNAARSSASDEAVGVLEAMGVDITID